MKNTALERLLAALRGDERGDGPPRLEDEFDSEKEARAADGPPIDELDEPEPSEEAIALVREFLADSLPTAPEFYGDPAGGTVIRMPRPARRRDRADLTEAATSYESIPRRSVEHEAEVAGTDEDALQVADEAGGTPMGLRHELVVEVGVRGASKDEGSWPVRAGTGYLIAPRRVLTAWHVIHLKEDGLVIPIDRFVVRRHGEDPMRPREPSHVRVACIAWQGNADLDLAVLEVAESLEEELEQELDPMRVISDSRPKTGDPVEFDGFAGFDVPDPPFEAFPFVGVAYGSSPDDPDFQIEPKSAEGNLGLPTTLSGWRGVSGAPVFVDDRLVGVICGPMKQVTEGRLLVLPSARVYDRADFWEGVGCFPDVVVVRRRERDKLQEGLAALLKANSDATTAISDAAAMPSPVESDGVAAWLMEESAARVVELLNRAHADLIVSARRDAAATILELLDLLLPFAYDWPRAYQARKDEAALDVGQQPEAPWITLDVHTECAAELILAGARGCPASLKIVADRDWPVGRGAMIAPRLETGFDAAGSFVTKDLVKAIARHLRLRSADQGLRDDALALLVGRMLRKLSSPPALENPNPCPQYLVICGDSDGRWVAAAPALRDQFGDALRIVRLEPQVLREDEIGIAMNLQDIHSRHAGTDTDRGASTA